MALKNNTPCQLLTTLCMAKTTFQMVINHTNGLHVGIHANRPNKLKATFF